MQPKRSAHTLAALGLLVAFAVGLIACLVAGAGSYRRLGDQSAAAYDRRTACAYLSTQVRRAESVSVEPFGEGMALCLHQSLDGRAYVTRIYCYDGWLMELFAASEGRFAPEDGQPVLALDGLGMELKDGSLALHVQDASGAQTLRFQIEVCHEE